MRRLLPLFAALLVAPAAHASIITVTFSGTIDQVGTGIASGFNLGDPFSGSFLIDGTVSPSVNGVTAQYTGAVSNLSFTFGGYTATASSGNVVVIDDQLINNVPHDGFGASSFSPTGADVASEKLLDAQLNMNDSSGSAFTSTAIPTSLSLAGFGFEAARLDFDTDFVSGTISALSYNVPEP